LVKKKVLVANRGEIVLRVARTCIKLGLEPYGIYSDADTNSLHIKYCKEAVKIGGRLPSESYLRMDKVIEAAKKIGCDLVHPGYGFLAESLEFSELCAKEGFIFVGPSPAALRLSGDKAKAREVASEVAPILQGKEVSSESDALSLAEKIGYPIILKAVKGGGGRGLRIVRSPEELTQAFASSKNEAMISFGSSRLYIEKYLENPRHIEVQILGDNSKIIHLGERECSVQRRHQKLIEETPSPALTNDLRQKMTETAIEITKKMRYNNAGTVEFLFKEGKFYFMELNSRIQVEHPITEQVTGIDIVEQQLRIATGEGLQIGQKDIKSRGHAIECRINAEHPISFVPYPGTITKFIPPENQDIRIDTALYSGYSIPPFYDSLIAKLICSGEDRGKAIEKMKKSLVSFRISGIPTTIPFHVSALNDERFVKGDYDTSFIEKLKPFSSRDGEMAAAVFSQLPRKTQFLKREDARDPWMLSRFDRIQSFDVLHDRLQMRQLR
jgi:acetyl-CoA carboxylase biotin carboxylase subunit